jgi:rhodanese-related sulfurtransferase
MKTVWMSIALITAFSAPAMAIDIAQDQVPEVKRTETQHYLTPKEAANFVVTDASNTLLIDARTPAELQFVGYTDMMDANVPYITYDYSGWDDKAKEYKRVPNSGFNTQIEDALAKKGMAGKKDARIIIMCRSGDRSAKAADLLAKSGYTNVWSQMDGFEGDKSKAGKRDVNGWKNDGLPWTYSLNKAKAFYLE